MTIPTFPEELPKPIIEGHREQRNDPRRRRTFDAGPPKFVRRYTAVAAEVSLVYRLMVWEKAVFDRFYIDTCKEGSLPFWFQKRYVDGMAILDENGVPLLDESGVQLRWSHMALCLFAEPPVSDDPIRGRQRIAFSVVELP